MMIMHRASIYIYKASFSRKLTVKWIAKREREREREKTAFIICD